MPLEDDLIKFRAKYERFLISRPDYLASFSDLFNIVDFITTSIVNTVQVTQEQLALIDERLNKLESRIKTLETTNMRY